MFVGRSGGGGVLSGKNEGMFPCKGANTMNVMLNRFSTQWCLVYLLVEKGVVYIFMTNSACKTSVAMDTVAVFPGCPDAHHPGND